MVTDRKVGEPLLGRLVLETLSLDCRQTPAAASDHSSGAYDGAGIPLVSGDTLSRASHLTEDVFNAGGGVSDPDGWEAPERLYMGPELPTEREGPLRVKLTEADKAGISKEGSAEMEQFAAGIQRLCESPPWTETPR